VKGKVISGFCFSYLNRDGEECLHTSSFGKSKTKAKRYFNTQNIKKFDLIKIYKLYNIQIVVGEMIEQKETNEKQSTSPTDGA
jgi:hypothetical protein